MADAEKYARWLVENEGKKGTPEFDTVAAAYKASRQQTTENRAGSVMAPERIAATNVADQVGPFESLAISAGRTGDKVVSGMKQLALGAVNEYGPKSFADAAGTELENLRTSEAGKDAAFGALADKRPITTALGQAVPYMAIPATSGVLPMALGAGALGASQYGDADQRLRKAAVDTGAALVGGVTGHAVGKLFAPASKSAMTETRTAALDAAKRLGVKPRLSEITGNPFTARVEDYAARMPGGAGRMADFAADNQAAINRAAGRSIGEVADDLSPRVFASARDRLGKVFEDIKALKNVTVNGRQVLPVQINKTVGSVADDVLRQQGKMIKGQADEQLISIAKQAKALASNSGRIDGETYQLVRSGLSDAAFDATGTNKALYGRLLKALDDSAEQSLRQGGQGRLADALKAARPQYGNLMVLEKGATAEGGNISAKRVASTLRTNNPAAFREGRMAGNPLYDVARVGEGMTPLRAGSQTAERQAMNDVLSLAVNAPLSWLGARATTSPLINNYALWATRSPTMGLLGKVADPAARGGIMGLLMGQLPVAPVVAEK